MSPRRAARFIQVGCGLFTTLPHRVVARDWSARTCIASNRISGPASTRGVADSCAAGSRHYAIAGRGCGRGSLADPARATSRIRATAASRLYISSFAARSRLSRAPSSYLYAHLSLGASYTPTYK